MSDFPTNHFIYHSVRVTKEKILVSNSELCARIWKSFSWIDSISLGVNPSAGKQKTEIIVDKKVYGKKHGTSKNFDFYFESQGKYLRRLHALEEIPGNQAIGQKSYGWAVEAEIRRRILAGAHHPALIRWPTRRSSAKVSGGGEIESDTDAHVAIISVALQLIFNELSGPWIAFKEALDCGLAPFAWQGTWPAGKLLAYLPPEAVTPAVAHLVVKSKEELAASTPLPELLESALPAITPSEEDRMLWQRMIDAPHRLLGFWKALAGNDAGDKLLTRVVSRVSGITVENDEMVVSFRPDVSGRVTRLRCQPGFRGKLRLPSTVKWVVALHNGMRFEVAGLETMQTLRWHRSDGKRFAGEWEGIWYTPDRDDPDEPFPAAPLMPFSDGDSLYILDPRHRRADEEPAVVRMGDGGGFGPPLPDPAGVCFLRALDGLTE